jgi:hypothetical protein
MRLVVDHIDSEMTKPRNRKHNTASEVSKIQIVAPPDYIITRQVCTYPAATAMNIGSRYFLSVFVPG